MTREKERYVCIYTEGECVRESCTQRDGKRDSELEISKSTEPHLVREEEKERKRKKGETRLGEGRERDGHVEMCCLDSTVFLVHVCMDRVSNTKKSCH